MASIEELGAIGAYHDEGADVMGVRRLALSPEDGNGRRLVKRWFEEAGLRVRVDAIGNTYADRDGLDGGLAPVMSGSHIDSVPTGGRFDGALGVLGALEVVRTLNDHGVTTRRPLTIAFFTDEEGCRFGTDMLGSAVAAGRIPLEQAYALTDEGGRRVRDELESIGFLGDEPVGRRRPHAYVECHVEQGPTLIHEAYDLGVVTGVQGISWRRLTITGASAHAGATPMKFRRDAGLAAARINCRIHEMCASGEYGAEMRATMGVIHPEPGMVNVIPGRVIATVDLRNPDDSMMRRAESDLDAFQREIASELGVTIDSVQTARTPAVVFNLAVQDAIEAAANARGLRNRRILAGAGHDAQEWASVCPAAMIFVPGLNDGISHSPRELSTPKQCADGINTLLSVILSLSDGA
ncbi:MAG: M20 family metallo-hydrolase [Phycisphaeraceae bacterium]|nr:M20 family metallo-hydrolase [Phycisphaeraceae bacterium]MCB9847314.1 M20 family metallo-hydrolase [Phycisphaeraceae bacterium]